VSTKAKLSVLLSTCARLALLLILACGVGAQAARAQQGEAATTERVNQFVMPLHGEGFIAFRVEAAPLGAPAAPVNLREIQAALTPQVLLADNHVVHRVLVDAEGNFVFGYDLVVEPVAATKQFKVSVKPLSAEFEEQLRARQPTTTATGANRAPQNVSTLPRSGDAQLIDDGDAFALDLLVNAETGVKIVDVVKVSFERAKLWSAPRRSVPLRDFTLGNVELAMRDYKLTINGELIGGGGGQKPSRGFAGALIWFYVPERGRFIVSLMPHEGYNFQKVGRIENNKISFTLGGDVYEWTSSAPVVGNGGNWNLWVLQDAGYISDFASAAQITEGRAPEASSPEWLRNPLARLRREQRGEFEPRANDKTKRSALKRPRLLAGGADSMENLLPKQ
jgi:hypothetical protein